MSLFNLLRPRILLKSVNPLYSTGKAANIGKHANIAFYSSKPSASKGIFKFTLVSASVGALVGVGYSGYTHYQINHSRVQKSSKDDESPILQHLPDVKPTRKVVSPTDASNLQLVLFQYQTCPFCCKVRAFLDSNGLSYDVVEVDAVLRQSIKWSKYKKVPILLAKTSAGYVQLNDSSAIISILSSYLLDKSQDISEIIKYYPSVSFVDDNGKSRSEILNKYFLMFNQVPKERKSDDLNQERHWRQWSDDVLVHMLSPNVYRSIDEAYQAFNWFADVGDWRKHFPSWECSLMINVGAYAMWFISKSLKKRHNLKDDVRESLYDECNNWAKAVKQNGSQFMGGSSPDLSDLAVYGILSSIEGCDAFNDLMANSKIKPWFTTMKQHIVQNKGAVYS